MMRDIQRKDPFPYGDALCVPLEEVTEFGQTSGTTDYGGFSGPKRWVILKNQKDDRMWRMRDGLVGIVQI